MSRLPHMPERALTPEEARFAQQIGNAVHNTRVQFTRDLELRKWCVEKAIEASKDGGPPAYVIEQSGRVPAQVQYACVDLADKILKFISAEEKPDAD